MILVLCVQAVTTGPVSVWTFAPVLNWEFASAARASLSVTMETTAKVGWIPSDNGTLNECCVVITSVV